MKSAAFQKRFYRDWVKDKGAHIYRITVAETDLQIICTRRLDTDYVRNRISLYRRQIRGYIGRDPRFLTSLKPIAVELKARPIVKAMAECARKAQVGPMAAVAGAIAEFIGKDLLRKGYRELIIENGGDIFLATRKTRRVGIYAGSSKLWRGLCIKVRPEYSPLGICASSGRFGHSLSFGSADCAIILAKSACLADAAATAFANRINSKLDLERSIAFVRGIKGVLGAAAIFKNNLISWGKVEFTLSPSGKQDK